MFQKNGGRFSSMLTINRVNKGARKHRKKKKEKNSARKEKKATQTLAIVLGKMVVFPHPSHTCVREVGCILWGGSNCSNLEPELGRALTFRADLSVWQSVVSAMQSQPQTASSTPKIHEIDATSKPVTSTGVVTGLASLRAGQTK